MEMILPVFLRDIEHMGNGFFRSTSYPDAKKPRCRLRTDVASSTQKLGLGTQKLGLGTQKLGLGTQKLGLGTQKSGLGTQKRPLPTDKQALPTDKQALPTSKEGLPAKPEADTQGESVLADLPLDLQAQMKNLGRRSSSPSQLRNVILDLCRHKPFSRKALALALGRNEQYLVRDHLRPMIEEGLLEYTIPENPNDRRQAYRAAEGAGQEQDPE